MKQYPNFGDQRNRGGAHSAVGQKKPNHCSSLVFLDQPPRKPSCCFHVRFMQLSFSLDEEHLACLVECVCTGSIEAAAAARYKVAKVFERKPALAARLSTARIDALDEIVGCQRMSECNGS